MGLLDFFNFKKSSASSKDLQRAQRENARSVERGMDNITEQIQRLEEEKDALWEKAKSKAVQGLKQEAARLLQQYKQKEVMIARLSKQVTFISTTKTNIEVAQTTQTAMESIGEMMKTSDIDPDKMDAIMGQIEGINEEIQDVDKVLNSAMKKQDEQIGRMYQATSSEKNADDDLMAILEKEVFGESGYSVDTNNGNRISDGVKNLKEEIE